MIIRSVLPHELDSLAKLSERTFRDSFSHLNTQENMDFYVNNAFQLEQLTREINHPSSAFYFLLDANKKLGYVKLNEGDAQTERIDGKSVEIQRIYLEKSIQGKGYGKIMVNHCIAHARQAEVDFIWLGVWEKNFNSIEFYKKCGFYEFSQHDFPFGDEVQTDILMRLDI